MPLTTESMIQVKYLFNILLNLPLKGQEMVIFPFSSFSCTGWMENNRFLNKQGPRSSRLCLTEHKATGHPLLVISHTQICI